jgi:hypothetical protein
MPQSTVIARLGWPLKGDQPRERAREEVGAFVNPFDDAVPGVGVHVSQEDRKTDEERDQGRHRHDEASDQHHARSGGAHGGRSGVAAPRADTPPRGRLGRAATPRRYDVLSGGPFDGALHHRFAGPLLNRFTSPTKPHVDLLVCGIRSMLTRTARSGATPIAPA